MILGGHSLGGMLAQSYAAWDFEGEPGYTTVDGLVLLDGAVGGDQWTATTGLQQYEDARQSIDSGAASGGTFTSNAFGSIVAFISN